MARPKKSDDLLGMVGAGVFFLGVVIVVIAPFVIVPVLFPLIFEGCYLESPLTWKTLVLGVLVLFALGIGISLIMGVLARVIVSLSRPAANKAVREILEFLVLWWFYSTLIQPDRYAFSASIVVTAITAVTEPILDKAIDRQKHTTPA
ncbi:hypothetical protein [Cutibacterium sp.]|uniref:hypothetical protein n=1 Tax=Cutibacterium sp. TaxID=1912221 RepID=UPI0026DC2E15|nr:hypothetical protein [Cutibacterium sp.]MDO4412900.1 hypothetical protein [Cutibacterium sp.]